MFIKHLLCATRHPGCASSALHERRLHPVSGGGGRQVRSTPQRAHSTQLAGVSQATVWTPHRLHLLRLNLLGPLVLFFQATEKSGPNVSWTPSAIRVHTNCVSQLPDSAPPTVSLGF